MAARAARPTSTCTQAERRWTQCGMPVDASDADDFAVQAPSCGCKCVHDGPLMIGMGVAARPLEGTQRTTMDHAKLLCLSGGPRVHPSNSGHQDLNATLFQQLHFP